MDHEIIISFYICWLVAAVALPGCESRACPGGVRSSTQNNVAPATANLCVINCL